MKISIEMEMSKDTVQRFCDKLLKILGKKCNPAQRVKGMHVTPRSTVHCREN